MNAISRKAGALRENQHSIACDSMIRVESALRELGYLPGGEPETETETEAKASEYEASPVKKPRNATRWEVNIYT